MAYTRRTILGAAAGAAAQAQTARKPWRPKLGVYCRYSPANIAFAGKEGFTCVQIATGGDLSADITDAKLRDVQRVLRDAGITVVSLGAPGNHFDPRYQERFLKTLELAGRMGVGSVGGSSGAPDVNGLDAKVREIVRLYESKYFAACEKHKVKILWEPHVNPNNIATSPVAFAALFKGFNDSPHVGLQLDPSHLAWQMIDPVECAREFASKIHNIHLKDTEILWPVLRRGGIQPLDNRRWWRFRLPGSGSIDWKGFFTALADAGYDGGMNIENEDQFTYPNYQGTDFTASFQQGYRTAHAYLRQLLPHA
ncbi:MAG: sugar phosphate isomerase/epimerase [Candidatus Solibacter usitatus]|nr:sugar phosphate isomerase/epimerase [Candidatus Solibacter usitatus]